MHDSIRLENWGIPTVAVATDEFRMPARAQASALGRPDFDAVYVPHPIQDQAKGQIEARAVGALDQIAERLLGNPFPSEPRSIPARRGP